jgi:methylenetetrahydrofolate reductase (NADPH)
LCRQEGIAAPIIPSIKVLDTKYQLRTLPRGFHLDIPYELSEKVRGLRPDDAEMLTRVGVDWALQQAREYISKGVPAIQFCIFPGEDKETPEDVFEATKQVVDALRDVRVVQ